MPKTAAYARRHNSKIDGAEAVIMRLGRCFARIRPANFMINAAGGGAGGGAGVGWGGVGQVRAVRVLA